MKELSRIFGIKKHLSLIGLLVLSLVFVLVGTRTGMALEANYHAHNRGDTRGDTLRQYFDMNHLPQWGAFETTVAYVVQFYPLWFTYYQSQIVPINRLAAPEKISPIYHIVVAINDDTLYASSLLDLRDQPVILTIPGTTGSYSILTLDPYGNIFESGIPPETPGTYAFVGPEWTGTLPSGVTPIEMPLNFSTLIFRADKYTVNGEDQTQEASLFRDSLMLATLSEYLHDPNAGMTSIFPEIFFSLPFKTVADDMATYVPIDFLKQLQRAVESSNTPPLSAYEELLTKKFNSLFGDGEFDDWAQSNQEEKLKFAEGTRTAHTLIVNKYLNHTGPTNWINFTNIGAWGNRVIERASITEFIQYGNGHDTAAYYHTFKDGSGAPLDAGGKYKNGYVLTFPKDQLPEAKRFWSVTAYTPDAIELVFNPYNKYVVASYTPGLETNHDGSLSIYMSPEPPPGGATANWLPVPAGPFNIMLRFYGPEGTVADATYVPPAIRKIKAHSGGYTTD